MTSNSIERAKLAINAKSDADFARWLGFATSVIAGYRKRDAVPLEQCIKIAEQTGVSLDWLIAGKGEMYGATAPELSAEQKMLLTGFDSLSVEQQDYLFALIRRMTRGETVAQATQHIINIHGSVGQANAGNGNIENLTLNSNK